MKITEVRIGNIVLCYNKKRTIIASDFAVINLYDCRNEENPYKPIPLTEEWLLKFGFEGLTLFPLT